MMGLTGNDGEQTAARARIGETVRQPCTGRVSGSASSPARGNPNGTRHRVTNRESACAAEDNLSTRNRDNARQAKVRPRPGRTGAR